MTNLYLCLYFTTMILKEILCASLQRSELVPPPSQGSKSGAQLHPRRRERSPQGFGFGIPGAIYDDYFIIIPAAPGFDENVEPGSAADTPIHHTLESDTDSLSSKVDIVHTSTRKTTLRTTKSKTSKPPAKTTKVTQKKPTVLKTTRAKILLQLQNKKTTKKTTIKPKKTTTLKVTKAAQKKATKNTIKVAQKLVKNTTKKKPVPAKAVKPLKTTKKQVKTTKLVRKMIIKTTKAKKQTTKSKSLKGKG